MKSSQAFSAVLGLHLSVHGQFSQAAEKRIAWPQFCVTGVIFSREGPPRRDMMALLAFISG
jgi:hypothetical protein